MGGRNRLGAVGGERCAGMGCVGLIRDQRMCRDGKFVPQLILVPKPSKVEECVWNSVAAPFLVRIHEASLALKVQPRLAF